LLLIVLVAGVAYALYLASAGSPRASIAAADELERKLAIAKRACVEGPPQGPACVEAARLTTEIAKSGR
jgi:hypothetical protein